MSDLLDQIRALRADHVEMVAQIRDSLERLKATAERLRQTADPDDAQLGLILSQQESIGILMERVSNLEDLAMRFGIAFLARAEEKGGSPDIS